MYQTVANAESDTFKDGSKNACGKDNDVGCLFRLGP